MACRLVVFGAGPQAWGHVLPLILAGMATAWRVVHSPFGRVLVGIRDNPARARALGYPIERYQLLVFALSAFLSGIAGGVFAISHGFASLQEVYWTTSGKVVVMTILGGIGTLWGPTLGAAIIVQLEDFLATAGVDAIGTITGVIFVVVVLLFRRGIWGTIDHLLHRRSNPGVPDPEPHLVHDAPPGDGTGRAADGAPSVEGTRTPAP